MKGNMIPIVESIIILVMSFNIRYANPNDGINNWDNRKEIVINIIEEYSPDLFGMQEVRGSQMKYLDEQLADYKHYGRSASEDPDQEASPIFFKAERFELMDGGFFWLSETTDKPNTGWDAAYPRIVTWGKLKELETGKIIFYFNTHFDHKGEQARVESAKLLKRKIKQLAGEEDYIVTGDFNLKPTDDGYKVLTDQDTSMAVLGEVSQFSNETREQVKPTFNGFDSSKPDEGPIDYIFVSPTISVSGYKVIDRLYDGRFPSDHYPIIAELEVETE